MIMTRSLRQKRLRGGISNVVLFTKKTVPYTPEQNGVAERYIKTLKDMARSQIQFAKIELQGIDMKHWCSAVRASAYVLNRTYKTSKDSLREAVRTETQREHD